MPSLVRSSNGHADTVTAGSCLLSTTELTLLKRISSCVGWAPTGVANPHDWGGTCNLSQHVKMGPGLGKVGQIVGRSGTDKLSGRDGRKAPDSAVAGLERQADPGRDRWGDVS